MDASIRVNKTQWEKQSIHQGLGDPNGERIRVAGRNRMNTENEDETGFGEGDEWIYRETITLGEG